MTETGVKKLSVTLRQIFCFKIKMRQRLAIRRELRDSNSVEDKILFCLAKDSNSTKGMLKVARGRKNTLRS